jgi:hypothetical protein
MGTQLLSLLAIQLTALSLVPAGAHLFELPHKIGLSAEAYLTVQSIYSGWALFGFVWLSTLLAQLALLWRVRQVRRALRPALAGTILLVLAFVVFFIWTFPANQATANWTALPAGWDSLRREWEFSHAAGALLIFGSLLMVTLASLRVPRQQPDRC